MQLESGAFRHCQIGSLVSTVRIEAQVERTCMANTMKAVRFHPLAVLPMGSVGWFLIDAAGNALMYKFRQPEVLIGM